MAMYDSTHTGAEIDNAVMAVLKRDRLTDFSLVDLQSAVEANSLEKYGLKAGDQKTINGRTYVIAGLNTMKGDNTPYVVGSNHVGLIVIPHVTQKWNASGNTYTGADNRGAGYKNCDLHYYLKNTLLPLVNTDLGSDHILSHIKVLSSGVNQSGVNRFGLSTGCASTWSYESGCKICALSEIQVAGSIVWSSSGFDSGEAMQQLEVFRRYRYTEIFGNEPIYLRDICSNTQASVLQPEGYCDYSNVNNGAYSVAALILYK